MHAEAIRPPPSLRHTKLGPGRFAAIASGLPSPFRSTTAALRVDHSATPQVPATLNRPLPSFRKISFLSGVSLLVSTSRSPSPSRSASAAVYVRSAVGPRFDAVKRPLPSFRSTRSTSGSCRPFARTRSRSPSRSRSPMLTLADVSDVVSRSITVVKLRSGAARCTGTAKPTATNKTRPVTLCMSQLYAAFRLPSPHDSTPVGCTLGSRNRRPCLCSEPSEDRRDDQDRVRPRLQVHAARQRTAAADRRPDGHSRHRDSRGRQGVLEHTNRWFARTSTRWAWTA